MKNTQIERDAYDQMKPGLITAQGFLGEDKRSLADIVASDNEAWRRAGTDPDTAVAFLEKMRDLGQGGLGEPIGIEKRWVVTAGDARGILPCPFHDGSYHKNSIVVVDEKTDKRIVYSDLSIHLLSAHRFCQGRGSPFRLDPETIAEMMQ
ncbi:MAG: hypothetical protein RBT62_02650 [Spirochaetia bacterium]|nr:hypothetical protein [Spirochaetia bacterium]